MINENKDILDCKISMRMLMKKIVIHESACTYCTGEKEHPEGYCTTLSHLEEEFDQIIDQIQGFIQELVG